MKYIITLAAIVLIGAGGYGGFIAGCFWQHRTDNEDAVGHNAAYWHPRTREYTWGNPNENAAFTVAVKDVMKPPTVSRPAEKPPVPSAAKAN